MKATELLKKQHRAVKKLFKDVESTENAKKRRTLLDEITQHLKLHTALEEGVFHPAVREFGTKKAEETIGEGVEEHHVVDLVLAELPKVDPEADTFVGKMTVLKEQIEHHVEEEEQEMFPMAEKRFGAEKSQELAREMEQQAGA